jgi:general secretion pathway protein A
MGSKLELFARRMDNMARTGGFSMILGMPGLGKSKAMHYLATRMGKNPDLTVAVMERPQSTLSDFYRELGERFGLSLKQNSRWISFNDLRAKWRRHIITTKARPVLLFDEAQLASTICLNELRILSANLFDSENLLTVVLAGDECLTDKLQNKDLLPLGTRIRTRLVLEPYTNDELLDYLNHILDRAGANHLITDEAKQVLAEHSCGNLRILAQSAEELLQAALAKNLTCIDESLYIETFSSNRLSRQRKQ